jgi:hypothetical protein
MSLLNQDINLYAAIPNMSEDRLAPLMKALDEGGRQHEIFARSSASFITTGQTLALCFSWPRDHILPPRGVDILPRNSPINDLCDADSTDDALKRRLSYLRKMLIHMYGN